MNKTWTYLGLTLAFFGSTSFASIDTSEFPNWTGFYIGGNAGYLWPSNNAATHRGRPVSANAIFSPRSQQIASSLASLGTNHIFKLSHGFLGGGQIGYDSVFSNNLLIGIDADIDGVGQLNTTNNFTNSVTTPLLGTYNANISVTKKINFLGLLKGRLGMLLSPTFLIYGSAGFAYGGAELNTTYTITETSPVFVPINQQNSVSRILSGWEAGAGGEWFFLPSWSLNLEYVFYDLGPMHQNFTLTQFLNTTPPIQYAEALIEAGSRFTENTVRVGINFHFS